VPAQVGQTIEPNDVNLLQNRRSFPAEPLQLLRAIPGDALIERKIFASRREADIAGATVARTGQNRTRLSPFSVLHSWFNDETEDDEAGERDNGQRYKKVFHDPRSQ
jgi:hypothetical protein